MKVRTEVFTSSFFWGGGREIIKEMKKKRSGTLFLIFISTFCAERCTLFSLHFFRQDNILKDVYNMGHVHSQLVVGL